MDISQCIAVNYFLYSTSAHELYRIAFTGTTCKLRRFINVREVSQLTERCDGYEGGVRRCGRCDSCQEV